jgi:hypothetical protein
MYLNETYSIVRTGKNLSYKFPVQNGALSPLLSNFVLEYAIRRAQENHEELKMNGKHQRLAYADDVNVVEESTDTIKKNNEAVLDASKEVGWSRSESSEN